MTHYDDLPDFRPLIPGLAERASIDDLPTGITTRGWAFWELSGVSDGKLAWLAVTRPGGRSALDRQKVWTLIPRQRLFIANWFVTDDHRNYSAQWIHTNVDIDTARDILLDVPQPSAEDMARITRPQAVLTLDQIDRHTVQKVLGKKADEALFLRR